jgi:hypothetical protein
MKAEVRRAESLRTTFSLSDVDGTLRRDFVTAALNTSVTC